MLRSFESIARRGTRWLAAALALLAGCYVPLAHAECRPTANPGVLVLPLSPVQLSVPLNAPVGTPVGSAHVAALNDLPFTCSGPDNARELRVYAPADTSSGLGKVYATNLPGIGFRIVTRGGSFAGIDDGPRDAAYRVTLPPHAAHLTGFAADIQFVTTGASRGGVLAPGKLASVLIGGNDFIDVTVPENAVVIDAMQCAPVSVNGEMSAGVGTMGSFTQEAAVISTGCGPVGVSLAIGVGQGYVYGSHPSLNANAAPAHHAHDAHEAGGFAALDAAHGPGAAGLTITRSRNAARASTLDDSQSDSTETGATQGSSGGGWSGGSFGAGGGGGMRR
ncbi:conserved exported hypothetical protein [Paraburkholderia tropica]|uniref:hypothetical protein n=1 Tax=Paraburkholderia tropica TaxID=92647 RepID=UPI001CB5655D|nr:hypothetical protein [Paraburkholderia tropica]CAG9222308.1 conserved exported hypothetical protein [Paraburkholderia tropica]